MQNFKESHSEVVYPYWIWNPGQVLTRSDEQGYQWPHKMYSRLPKKETRWNNDNRILTSIPTFL